MSNPLQHKLVLSRAQVREVDRRAIEEIGIPGIVLMENAGRNAAALIAAWVDASDRVAIVCGPGNNGGDGFVIARHLSNAGIAAELLLACDPSKLTGDALVNHRVVERMQLPTHGCHAEAEVALLPQHLAKSDLIVDALLGTGFNGTPRFPIDCAFDAINAAGRPVVSVDVPSGMDCDTGQAAGGCVQAWRTITFVAMKKGFHVPGADAMTGEVFVADIGAPVSLIQDIAASGGV